MNLLPNRRDILRIGGAAISLGALGQPATILADEPSPATRPTAARRPIKKAVMWDMIGVPGSVLDKFKALQEAGFDGVEMNSPGGPPNGEIKRACAETGILIEGMVDSGHWHKTLSHNDPKMREMGLESLQTALRDCHELGGTSVLLVPGVVDKSVSYADCYKRSQEQIRKAIPLARELRVKIAIENVWNNFLLSPLEAVRYIDEFDAPDAIGWHFDIGNVILYGWPEQWARILNKRVLKLHIKEYSRQKCDHEGRWAGFNVELLQGDNDWPSIMKALDEIGYSTWACAEVPGGGIARLKVISQKMDQILSL